MRNRDGRETGVRVCCVVLKAAGVCINLAVHPNAIEKGEDFAASGDKLDESPTDSGSSTSPSDNTSEESAPTMEMSSLLYTHSSAQLINDPVTPSRSIPTG